jgi:AICAR transformylase/IMP cyclohydrolase PurH
VARARRLLAAYERAFATDPESAFGGIIAFNRELDGDTAAGHRRAPVRRGHRRPAVSEAACAAVAAKKNVRVLVTATGHGARARTSSVSVAACWYRTADLACRQLVTSGS